MQGSITTISVIFGGLKMYDFEYLHLPPAARATTKKTKKSTRGTTKKSIFRWIDGGREPNLQSLDLKTLIGFRF